MHLCEFSIKIRISHKHRKRIHACLTGFNIVTFVIICPILWRIAHAERKLSRWLHTTVTKSQSLQSLYLTNYKRHILLKVQLCDTWRHQCSAYCASFVIYPSREMSVSIINKFLSPISSAVLRFECDYNLYGSYAVLKCKLT